MRIIHLTLTLAFLLLYSANGMAYRYVGSGLSGNNNPNLNDSDGPRAAQCIPATGLRDLEWNNVRARIETGGNMWQDRENNRAAYEVPKPADNEQGVSAIYAGGLWLGGKSLDETLKLAAVKFRGDGNDYWPGPLTRETGEVSPQTCKDYDKFYVSLRQDTEKHHQYHSMVQAGASAEEFEEIFPDGYTMPSYFLTWPAHGNVTENQDFYLSPYKDFNNNGIYDPENGDYPWFDHLKEIDCRQRTDSTPIPLYGDQNFFWIFNDKGNIHTESGGQAIGMEIRAQAFAFTTNDEVNNMTFLNYTLINQGSQTLTNTFFGSWVDPDLGSSIDDFVGCDVQRGLGYCYNGDAFDEQTSSSLGYGDNPPAVGVDFFEGPFQNRDTLANPLTIDIAQAIAERGIPYKGLGIGYGDSIIDNERFGMRRFVYYNNNTNPINGEPEAPQHFYNYLQGIWKNGSSMLFGGNGATGAGVISGLPAQYMFPDNTDPYNWSTGGVVPPAAAIPWTEQTAGNLPNDRRFIQSAGPFTLKPGSKNNITLGVVWARAVGGDPFASVELLRLADDKAQSLFDNCFELVNGPDAPDVTIQELNKEIILMLTNENPLSNNYLENYLEFDPSIPDSTSDGTLLSQEEKSYRFEGYLVYQLANSSVSNAELNDVSKARLIAQCDLQNDVSDIINYNRDQTTGLITPYLAVQADNAGLNHSFRVTEDAFALGDRALINHKSYYFMVVAYGYNNYQNYDVATSTGQDDVFKASRKGAVGEIQKIVAIPHDVKPEAGGTILHSGYGEGVYITRLEGKGNGLNAMTLSPQTEAALLQPPYTLEEVDYMPGGGPVNIKVVDPLRVPSADFTLTLQDLEGDFEADSMFWYLTNLENNNVSYSVSSFSTLSEDLLLEYGFSITFGQYQYFNEDAVIIEHMADFIEGTIEFENPAAAWLFGIPDEDGFSALNWIRSGSVESSDDASDEETIYDDYREGSGDQPFTDQDEIFEKVLDGTWAPYCLTGYSIQLDATNDTSWRNLTAPTSFNLKGDLTPVIPVNNSPYISNIRGLNNVDIVFTSDKSKWTRCPVLEMQPIRDLIDIQDNLPAGVPNTGAKMLLRRHRSVDKNGLTSLDQGYNAADGDKVGIWGMGWFPGYAIDLGTGERLNMAFGEDSWLTGENGNDMLWNPGARLLGSSGSPIFGGQHWIYVFKNASNEAQDNTYMPRYDEGQHMFNILSNGPSDSDMKKMFRACTWVGSALASGLTTPEQGLIPTTARVRLRVAKEYRKYAYDDTPISTAGASVNEWRPLYKFSTKNLAPVFNSAETLESVLDMINVVPNPYYAFSSYETNKLDNRVKITNLPEACTVKIFDLNGTLIRTFKKADPTTSLDWDLKNHKNIPIASGTYIIHVDVPGIGEKILKWFGIMRPIDLDSF